MKQSQNQTLPLSLSLNEVKREREGEGYSANRNRFGVIPDDIHRRDAMIVIGYKIEDAGWGHKYRRVIDKDQQRALRNLTGRTHVRWQDVEAFAQLNVFFRETCALEGEHSATCLHEANENDTTYTHMRGEHADGATQ